MICSIRLGGCQRPFSETFWRIFSMATDSYSTPSDKPESRVISPAGRVWKKWQMITELNINLEKIKHSFEA
jgi:hypothetical protein